MYGHVKYVEKIDSLEGQGAGEKWYLKGPNEERIEWRTLDSSGLEQGELADLAKR